MKKILSLVLALAMFFSVSAVAFADSGDELVHNGTLPVESTQDVKITINGLHVGGEDDGKNLPSEYHVRVVWNIANGVYDATATDGKEGFQNFIWDCTTLQYLVNSNNDAEDDVRKGNWTTTPKVAFEVTNASTPDKSIYVSASVKGTNTWKNVLKGTSLETQNTNFAVQEVEPVKIANMGTGVNSYEQNLGALSHNVKTHEYTLDWNYDALNAMALNSLKNGSVAQTLTNTFVVTIAAQ